jgi:hypothetical protein
MEVVFEIIDLERSWVPGVTGIEVGYLADFAHIVFHCQAVLFYNQESLKKLRSGTNGLSNFFFSFHFVAIINNIAEMLAM